MTDLTHVSDWPEAGGFSPRERAALRWSEVLTMLPMSDGASDAFDELSQHFDPKEIVAMTVAVIAANGRTLGSASLPARCNRSWSIRRGLLQRSASWAAELQRLETELARVREAYRRAVEGPPGPRWCENGTVHRELDDPAIAPG